MAYFSRRSASVRVEASQGLRRRPTSSPPLKRSSSVSSSIEIGAKGSIVSLIGRDLSSQASDPAQALTAIASHEKNSEKKLTSAHHANSDTTASHNHNKKPASPSPSLIVEQIDQKLPKWKRLLNRLIKGGLKKGKEKDRKKKTELPNVSDEQKISTNNGSTAYQDSAKSTANPTSSSSSSSSSSSASSASSSSASSASSSSPLEPSTSQQTSPIWERRNFGEIKPLNMPPVPARRTAQKHH